ncbi:MAG: mechanosensitive ion channel family protein [Candidatus Omnitrophica bacterium]|nr:mechanosensitive ion channel family protein [Candidatus Omnitrophota bacterium]
MKSVRLTGDAPLSYSTAQRRIIETVGISILFYIILFSLIKIINKRVNDIKVRHTIRKNTIYLINIILICSVFLIWVQNINSITLLLGFMSAGLALALQEVILCVAGWFVLISRRPYVAGDRIELSNIRGDVIDIRLFQTSLLEIGNWVDADQSTGRIVNIPNSALFKSANYNYSRGFEFIWNEIPVLVTFESDWQKGRDIMMIHAKKLAEGMTVDMQKKIDIMKNRYMIYYGKLTPIVYVNIKESGVKLTLRYLTEAKKRRSTEDQLCQAILNDFAQESSVDFAYPTYRIVKTD